MSDVAKLIREIHRISKACGNYLLLEYIASLVQNTQNIIRTKSLRSVDHDIENLRKFIFVKKFGYKFIFSSDSFPLIREIFLKNCYGFKFKKYGDVVDLGANRGVFSMLAAKFSDNVYSIECNPNEFLTKFQVHSKLNRINNAIFIGKFVSNIDSKATISLNFLCNLYNIKTIEFLKIDIEGGEETLFSSNLEWIKKVMRLSMEIHPCFNVNWRHIINILNDHGFIVRLFDKDLGRISSFEGLSVGYIWAEKK